MSVSQNTLTIPCSRDYDRCMIDIPSHHPDSLITAAEAARYLGVVPATITRYVAAGKLVAAQTEPRRLYRAGDVNALRSQVGKRMGKRGKDRYLVEIGDARFHVTAWTWSEAAFRAAKHPISRALTQHQIIITLFNETRTFDRDTVLLDHYSPD